MSTRYRHGFGFAAVDQPILCFSTHDFNTQFYFIYPCFENRLDRNRKHNSQKPSQVILNTIVFTVQPSSTGLDIKNRIKFDNRHLWRQKQILIIENRFIFFKVLPIKINTLLHAFELIVEALLPL